MNILKVGTHVLGSVAFAAMQWLILVIISKSLGTESAGAFAYYLAIFAPLAIFCALNLKSVYSADTANRFLESEYEAVRTLFIIIYILAGIFVLSISHDYFLIGVMIFSVKLIEIFSELIYGYWVKKGHPQYYGYSKILKLIAFIALAVIVFLLYGAEKIYFIYPLAFLLVFLGFDVRFSNVRNIFNLELSKNIFLKIFPFVLTSFLISFNTSIPRFFIDHYYDKKMVAEFMYLIYFVTIFLLPLNSLFQAILPIIKMRKKEALIFNLVYIFTAAMVFYFGCDFFLERFYNYSVPIDYKIKLLIVIILIFQSLVAYLNMLYISKMNFKKILIVTFVNTIMLLSLNFIFLKCFGYYGVYYASALCSIFLVANLFFNYLKERRIEQINS